MDYDISAGRCTHKGAAAGGERESRAGGGGIGGGREGEGGRARERERTQRTMMKVPPAAALRHDRIDAQFLEGWHHLFVPGHVKRVTTTAVFLKS